MATEVNASPLNQQVSAEAAQVAAHQLKIKQSVQAARQFVDLYYEKLDKSRHTLGQLYHEQTKLIWNGNEVTGMAAVLAFMEKLPVTETELLSFDAQPVMELDSNAQAMTALTCSGRQKMGPKLSHTFTQSFLLAAENNKWKIVADTMRYLK